MNKIKKWKRRINSDEFRYGTTFVPINKEAFEDIKYQNEKILSLISIRTQCLLPDNNSFESQNISSEEKRNVCLYISSLNHLNMLCNQY
jgi:hypothetical protein